MVKEPLRASVAGLAVTAYVTKPGPFPVAPAVTLIQPPLADTVQAQPAGVATDTVPDPPSLPNAAVPGAIASVQTGVDSVGDVFLTQLAIPTLKAATSTTRRRYSGDIALFSC